jgi:methylmalonyl-CoA mutase
MHKSNFYNFPEVSKSEWWDKIREDLKGQSEDSLFTNLGDNLRINPFYNAEDLDSASAAFQNLKVSSDKKAPNDWELVQCIHLSGKEPGQLREFLSHAEEGDADYIEIIPDEANSDLSFLSPGKPLGLMLSGRNKNLIGRALKTLRPEAFSEVLVDTGYSSIITGASSIEEANANISEISESNDLNPYVINTDPIVESGGDALDEGTYALALLNEMLRANTGGIKKSIVLRLNTESNFFLVIAKVRALRKLAGVILDSWQVESPFRIEVHTSIWNKSVYDRYTNILRNTSESFAAVAAGTDMLTIRAFETALGIENEFSLRNARNISHLLRHESHIDKVKDVSAGSYFVESLTSDFAREVWSSFLKIQEAGGLEVWLSENPAPKKLSEKAEGKRGLFGKRKLRMIGTNVYPNTLDQLSEENIHLRNSDRLSSRFERFRVALDTLALNEGEKARPSAMLLRLGKSPMRFARSGFSANFLETAGFRMIEQDAMPENFKSGQMIVICGSDEDYLSNGSEWINEIKKINKNVLILLAGMPDNQEELKNAGVDFFIHIKAPLEKTLDDIFKALNIETA